MRVNSLTNISSEKIVVKLTDGVEVSLPSNKSISGVDVANLGEISSRVKVKEDLTEVGISKGKTKLYD
jgi:hypothetical protein